MTHRAAALSTELRELKDSKVTELSSYVTGVMHTARIRTVKVIISSDKWIKMANFKLGNEIFCKS